MMKYAGNPTSVCLKARRARPIDEIANQRLTAERHALAADRRLDHLLVLARA